MPSDDLRYPTIEGAIEVVKQLEVEPQSIDLDCQDWKYTFPRLLQLCNFQNTFVFTPTVKFPTKQNEYLDVSSSRRWTIIFA